MKLIYLSKKFITIFTVFVCIIFTSIILVMNIKVEDSIKAQLTVDRNNLKSVVIDSRVAYKIRNKSLVILNYEDKYHKIYIESMETLKDGMFKLKLKINDSELIADSVLDSWIIFGEKSLFNLLFDY